MGKGSGNCQRPAISLYGLSDLHLGPGTGKKHYSSGWEDHQSKMRKSWDQKIQQDDIVLLPGDFSWHYDPEDLKYEYAWIDDRPGCLKVMSPGNHDNGEVWQSLENAEQFVEQFQTTKAVMGNAIRIENPFGEKEGLVIAGAQGSQNPQDYYFNTNAGRSAVGKESEAIRFVRELVALQQAIQQAQELRQEGDKLVVMIHYPPFGDGDKESAFSDMIENAEADLCVYGHLHKKAQFSNAFQGNHKGTEYRFVGADFLKFSPTKLGEWHKDNGIDFSHLDFDAKQEWVEPPPRPKKKKPKLEEKATEHKSLGNMLLNGFQQALDFNKKQSKKTQHCSKCGEEVGPKLFFSVDSQTKAVVCVNCTKN